MFDYFHDSTFGVCRPIPYTIPHGENGSYGFFDMEQMDVLALDNEEEK